MYVKGEVCLLCASVAGTSPWEFITLLLDIAIKHELMVFREPGGPSWADRYCLSSSRISSAGLFAVSGFLLLGLSTSQRSVEVPGWAPLCSFPALQTSGFSSWPQASQHGSWVAHIKYFLSPEVLSLTCSRSRCELGLLALDPVFPSEYWASRLVPAVPTQTVQITDFFGLAYKVACWQCSVWNGSISVQA